MTKTPFPLWKLALAVLIFGGLIAVMWAAKHPYEIYREQPLPAFTLMDLEGKEFSSHDWMGKGPIAINIMASWCGPCRNELPLLEDLSKHIPVYAIATQDDPEKLKALFEKRGNPFTQVGIDNSGQMMFTLRTNGIPTTLFLDGSHRLAFVKEGSLAPSEVERLVKKIRLLR